jgi:hypothetical protein
MFKWLVLAALTPVAVFGCTTDDVPEAPPIHPAIASYYNFLEQQHQPPVDYIMGLFETADIVVLCERSHPEMTQYELVVQILEDERFQRQVGRVFTELGSRSYGAAVSAFLHASGLAEEEATQRLNAVYQDMFDDGLWPNYNLYEFLKRVWVLNRGLPASRRIDVHPSDLAFDWGTVNRDRYEEYVSNLTAVRDSAIADEIIERVRELRASGVARQKALVIMNYRHAFTNLDYTGGKRGDNVAGRLMEAFPGRVANVWLNSFALRTDSGGVQFVPVQDGRWDAAFQRAGNRSVGFDLEHSPFGADYFDLHPRSASHVTYGSVFTGLVFYLPLEEHRFWTGLPGFLTEERTELLADRLALIGAIENRDSALAFLAGLDSLEIESYSEALGTDFTSDIDRWLEPEDGDGQEHPTVFLEPVGSQPIENGLPVYAVVTDSARLATYRAWIENDAARWALELYEKARRIAQDVRGSTSQPRGLHIALVPNGNHAAVGYRLVQGADTAAYPAAAYVKLGPQEWRFGITLLHETGHVVLRTLYGGAAFPKKPMAAISHTTAALTDRATAFDEGYAIHLEALLVHLSDERHLRNKYRHEQMLFGTWPGFLAEYYRQSADLMTFSQTVSRYYLVRENAFAFASATPAPDYLRTQLEKGRDYSTLRTANQMLQSEGFYGSFFFSLLSRGRSRPDTELVLERQEKLLTAIAHVLRDDSPDADTPYLLRLMESYIALYPDEAEEVLDLLLDLSHGVFVDLEARARWRDHYLAALRLDLAAMDREGMEARRAAWRTKVRQDPAALYALLGPQIRCVVPAATVELPALGVSNPLSFDANTVQENVLRVIPGISDAEVARWTSERDRRPFLHGDDIRRRVMPTAMTVRNLECGSARDDV